MKNLKKLKNTKILSKKEQKTINGEYGICASICSNDPISCKWIYQYCQCVQINCF